MTFLESAKYIVKGMLLGTFLVACSSESAEPEYGFGETDMQTAILGDWSGTMSLTGQMPTSYTLNIVQVPSLQPACGNRAFNSPLCIESTAMTLNATFSTADKTFDAVKLQGDFSVYGLEMTYGELSLSGTGVKMYGGLEVAKPMHDLTVDGDHAGTATMQR